MDKRPMKSDVITLDGGSAPLATLCFAKHHVTIIGHDGSRTRLAKRETALLRKHFGSNPRKIAAEIGKSLLRKVQGLAA